MIPSLVRRWLGDETAGEAHAGPLDTIAAAIDRLDPQHARFVAAFAYLLSRVAHADHEVTAAETTAMERLVREVGRLPEEEAVIVVQLATTQSAKHRGTEDYLVAREFDEVASEDEKRRLLSCLFAVCISSNARIVTAEDNEIRQIAGVLRIDRREVNRLRAEHRAYLAVLQK